MMEHSFLDKAIDEEAATACAPTGTNKFSSSSKPFSLTELLQGKFL
jgi:hypothetical protein